MPDDSNPFRIPGAAGASALAVGMRHVSDGRLRELQNLQKQPGSKGLADAKSAAAPDSEQVKAATQFEALLLHQMIKEMWNTVPKDGLFSGSHEEEMYRDMLHEGIANDIAEKHSIGIRDVLVRDMKKFGKEK